MMANNKSNIAETTIQNQKGFQYNTRSVVVTKTKTETTVQ